MDLYSVGTFLFVLAAFAFLAKRVVPQLLVRTALRGALSAVGKDALAKQPEQIKLTRVSSPEWRNESVIQQQAAPLVRAGFNDLGTFSVDKMPGVLVRMLFQPQTNMAAHICEHPKAGSWIEFAVRYNDGGSDTLTTLPPTGIKPPDWLRTTRADKSTPTDQLYQQLLAQRRPKNIKAISTGAVAREFEEGYMRYMIWKNNHGISPEEVAQVMLKWVEKRQGQASGQ
jgi:hypothetical protein